MDEKEKESQGEQQGTGALKRTYSPPSVVSEPIYETLALACGKLAGQGGICNSSSQRS